MCSFELQYAVHLICRISLDSSTPSMHFYFRRTGIMRSRSSNHAKSDSHNARSQGKGKRKPPKVWLFIFHQNHPAYKKMNCLF